MMDQRVAFYSFAFGFESSGKSILKLKTEMDRSIARPIMYFADSFFFSSTSILMMNPFSIINQNSFSGAGFSNLEIADINMRTHSVIENRKEIELSFTFHNRGGTPLKFGYESMKVNDAGCFKFIHIDHVKDPSTNLNYTLRSEEPIIFFERYESETFEQKNYLVPEIRLREEDVADLI